MPSTKEEKRNLILADFPVDDTWELKRQLDAAVGRPFEVRWVEGRIHVNRFKRMANYFVVPFGPFLHRRRWNIVVTWQQFYGIVFAFLSRLFGVKKTCRLVILTFIYRPKHGLAGKLYERWMRYAVNNRYVDLIVVYSRAEVERYHRLLGIDRDRLRYVPLSIPPEAVPEEGGAAEETPIPPEPFVFAPGKSNRDYELLVEALAPMGCRMEIACDNYAGPVSEAVTVHNRLFGARMMRFMSRCAVVAIPLKDLTISSRQLALLQAMSLGKPIVVSRSQGVADYVTHGVNALVVDNTPQAWREAVSRLLADEALRAQLSCAALDTFERNHSERAMARAIASLIASLR